MLWPNIDIRSRDSKERYFEEIGFISGQEEKQIISLKAKSGEQTNNESDLIIQG